MGMSNTSVNERKRTQRRMTRRQEKQKLVETAHEEINEAAEAAAEELRAAEDAQFGIDYRPDIKAQLRRELQQVLQGHDPHRNEQITSSKRFGELIDDYIEDLGPLTLQQRHDRTYMRLIIEDLERSAEPAAPAVEPALV